MKKALNYFLSIISIMLFVFSAYIVIAGTKAKVNNEILSFFGYGSPAVVTNSMAGDKPDSFEAGSLVITKNVDFEDIVIGDVIVFQSEGILKIHRVKKVDENGNYITQGDNNNREDKDPVTQENYQGKMINHFSFFGIGKKLPNIQMPILGALIIFLIIYIFVQIFQMIIKYKNSQLEKLKEEVSNNERR